MGTKNELKCAKFQLTPDAKKQQENKAVVTAKKINEDDFFDLLTRTQSKRMDDQRCSLKLMAERKPLQDNNQQQNILPKEGGVGVVGAGGRNQLLEMIADLQSSRMDEQRAALPGLINSANVVAKQVRKAEPDDAFLDMLMRCQGSRIEEQRSELPKPGISIDVEEAGESKQASVIGATVPDEDFFSLISRIQGGRMEDQRATIPALRRYNPSSSNNAINGDHKPTNSSSK